MPHKIYDPQLNTKEGRQIYIKILDYLIMTPDPLYKKIVSLRRKIMKIKENDFEELKKYFNSEFDPYQNNDEAGITAWEYFKNYE